MSEKNSTSSTNTSSTHSPAAGHRRWVWIVAGILGILVILAGLTTYAYASQSSTIIRNTTIGAYPVGGLDSLTALSKVETRWKAFQDASYVFRLNEESVEIPINNSASQADELIIDLAGLDLTASLDQAYDLGHTGPVWKQAWERLLAWMGYGRSVGVFSFSTEEFRELLTTEFGKHDTPAQNAGIEYDEQTGTTVTPSQPGTVVDYDQALAIAKQRLRALDPTPITIRTIADQPDIQEAPTLTEIAETQVPPILDRAPLKLILGEQSWEVSRAQLADIIGFVRSEQTIRIGFDQAKTEAWLNLLRPEIDIEPRDAKFNVVDGRVEEFQTSVVGRELNAAATVAAMEQSIFLEEKSTAEAVVIEKLPLTDTTSTNDLGIRELVAEGITDFRGSPRNRVFNLTLGAERIHGLLLKPGETFSLVEALGPIDQAHGWRSELVIKGTDITPEFGGGLCQVATTLFRAALNTGLPIVERRNHSLRISYYEPPIGLDATIYEPKPDLRFTNDYNTTLLLQTRVEGTKLIFSFYGTKDGRTVDIPEPHVYNRSPIPPDERVEVDDLAPGEEECQAGHPGADATATYTVTKPDGTSVTQTFQSHYRPIPKICRVGKKAET